MAPARMVACAMNGHARRLVTRRARHVSSSLSILYPDDPIHVVRGQGQYLYDADGAEYLDCMNNVAHIGHSHPRVAEAASRQLALVNTNTRFLYEPLVDFAERLCSLTADPLSVCLFVNSGSEANELALRMTRLHSRRDGVVTLTGAYHGNTSSLVDISSYKFDGAGGAGRPPHLQLAPAPDTYRGPHRGADAGRRYAAEIGTAIERGDADGHPVGLFMSEPVLGTAGQIVPPDGYLREAYEAARDRGAVVVADEVQVGFGRLGTDYWASTALGATPDVLTLGKPMGNGFPLGAVITTPEIADDFNNGMEYFNTFGGSPLACAVGLAVLEVLRDESLPQHAETVGAYFVDGWRTLAERHEAIGDVRGMGLFIGVELVEDRETKRPGTALARWLVAELRTNRILMSTDGIHDNVLKIKPPLVFDRADADRVLEVADSLLARAP